MLSGPLHEGEPLIIGLGMPKSRVGALGLRLGF